MRLRMLFLLLILMTNSCILRRKPAQAIHGLSDRTKLEFDLSEIALHHAECYLFNEPSTLPQVIERLSQCKGSLVKMLRTGEFREETHALSDYFERFYPTAADALSAITCCRDCACVPPKFKSITYSQQPETMDSFRFRTSRMVNWLIGWAAERLTYKPDSNRFLENLAVNSYDKDKAAVTLFYLDGRAVTQMTTPGSFQGIYRGLYRYKVERDGYKPFDSGAALDDPHLNLVDWKWNPNGLSCTLVPISSHSKSLPCNLQ